MSTVKWAAGWTSRSTVLTTELNALANGSRTAVGTEINNATNLDQYGKLELAVDFVSAPSAGAYVNVYALTAADGTNYEDGSSSLAPGSQCLVARIEVQAVTPAQRLTSQRFALDPAKTKFILENQTGQPFPATGSTLTLYTANDSVA